ncbi:hypothetical protein JOD54_002579 [Actinokineospora baliensis]|uniref:hypothetical protein n=1 Tax=Actinokineospora baliensis TaxID=547056 RepID=UPI001958A98A|nr:hypothetical protein [Actinokineospora baliensis]MBM7772375.1 hypothetical protein [Actinokineospora baliensis]
MKTVAVVAAACALLAATTGCGSATAYSATAVAVPSSSATPGELARVSPTRSGEQIALGNGLTITVSAPKAFVPTGAAFPSVPRAVGFEMTVHNDGSSPYSPTLLSLSAVAGGAASRQVIDSAQGYAGAVGTEDVAPGRSTRFSVAFALPTEKVPVVVTAQPDPAGGAVVTVFDGQA